MSARNEIDKIMVHNSGLTADIIAKGEGDATFDEVLLGMRTIHMGKEVLYGKYIETHGSDPEMFAMMEHFADIKRKYVRAEQYMKKTLDGEKFDLQEMFETYSDMAVYAAMGVQLVAHLTRRNAHDRARSDDGSTRRKSEGDGPSSPVD